MWDRHDIVDTLLIISFFILMINQLVMRKNILKIRGEINEYVPKNRRERNTHRNRKRRK